MAKRGPKPKPAARRKAEGNPGRRQTKKDAPLVDGFSAPPGLSDAALAVWTRNIAQVKFNGYAVAAYIEIYADFCRATALLEECERMVAEQGIAVVGARGTVTNPHANFLDKMIAKRRALAGELGLTPGTRPQRANDEEEKPEASKNRFKQPPGTLRLATG